MTYDIPNRVSNNKNQLLKNRDIILDFSANRNIYRRHNLVTVMNINGKPVFMCAIQRLLASLQLPNITKYQWFIDIDKHYVACRILVFK